MPYVSSGSLLPALERPIRLNWFLRATAMVLALLGSWCDLKISFSKTYFTIKIPDLVVLKCTWYQFRIIFWQIDDLVLYIFHFILCMLPRSFLLWKLYRHKRPNFNLGFLGTYFSYISWISVLYLVMSDGLDSSTLIWRLFIISASCWIVSKMVRMIPGHVIPHQLPVFLMKLYMILKRSSFFVLFKVSNLLLRPW